jgi:tricorn protease-like protein
VLALALAAALIVAVPALAGTAQTERVSVSSSGAQANGLGPSISANGRFVAFDSSASNLVAGDTNGLDDVFVHDRRTGETQRVSVSSAGTQANNPSYSGRISANGRFVAFFSFASNLVKRDTNGEFDVFVHDLKTGRTERVSVSSDGEQANGYSALNSGSPISVNGHFVSFFSEASNLVRGDTNGAGDIFVHDLKSGQTDRVSMTSDGEQANGGSFVHSISASGRFVAFDSYAKDLVGGDTNRSGDVFVNDRRTGETTRVSVSSAGEQAKGGSFVDSISANGRFVPFVSSASNLVAGDTNRRFDIFVHDRTTGETQRVSVSSDGEQASGDSRDALISANGRFVAFDSSASNLVAGDTNGFDDVFVRGPLR